MGDRSSLRAVAEERFAGVFAHIGLIVGYARSRGAHDPEGIAAEVMAIPWRRLADVPVDDARPWLIATARNLLLADWRKRRAEADLTGTEPPPAAEAATPRVELDPELEAALMRLSASDREALLLVAWEDLTPQGAAASPGISPAAFRVRLHRARRRLVRHLDPGATNRSAATATRLEET
jgi:RNA polymerase sigma-70 factor (ECF subfamily)